MSPDSHWVILKRSEELNNGHVFEQIFGGLESRLLAEAYLFAIIQQLPHGTTCGQVRQNYCIAEVYK